jgi:AcrR family transcriptional regulator
MTEGIKDGRRDRRKRSRERIVEAAFLLVQRGNWRPSVKDIAAQAGVSVRTVFDIFGTLDDVYEELMRNYSISLRHMINDVQRNDPNHGMLVLRLILMGRLPVAAANPPQEETV